MIDKFPLSVVVLTKNEEARIRRCLDSVTWVDEILVVDDESTDRTREIVGTYTDRIFVRKMEIEGIHRNWAYAQARHPWVLSLDSDEVVTPELKDEIIRVLSAQPKENGFTIPRKNYIGTYWVRYGGWYPSPQLKLFRRDEFRYEEVAVHPRAFMDDPCGHLKCDLIHYSYKSIEDFLAKLNRQTTWEAQKWRAQNKPMRLRRFLWRTYDRFMRCYFGRQGWRDGFMGLTVAFFAGLYQFVSYLKYREMDMLAVKAVFLDRDGVINKYPGDFQYVKSPEEFQLLPGVGQALRKLNDAGFRLFVVSNQAGVAKGLYSQATLDAITQKMLSGLKKAGAVIEKVYYCTHLPDGECACRKPKTGLVEMAIAGLELGGGRLERSASFFIGDSVRDVETGKGAGLKTVMLFSGRERPENKNRWPVQPDLTAADLSEAVKLILAQ